MALAGCGTDVSGPPASLFACVFGEARALRVGEVVTFDGAGNRSLCLTAPDDGAAFAYIPFLGAPPPQSNGSPVRLGLEVLGAGIVGADAGAPGLPSPSIPQGAWPGPADGVDGLPSLRLGGDLHGRIREREIAELEPKIRPGPTPPGPWAPAPTASAAPLLAGDLVSLNVALSCTVERMRTGRVMRVSRHAIVLADVANPANGFTAVDFDHFAAAFDTLVYPTATRHFGTPSDIDGNDRIIIFFTAAVNAMTPPGSSSFTAGVFWSGDLFPATATARLEPCPAANQAEIFYMAVPDPTGSAGPQVSIAWVRDRAVQVMGHEYQHLLNAARRLHVNQASTLERPWLNEGLSHIAEELLFYAASGLAPRSNITLAALQSTPGAVLAYNRYMAGNHENLGRYLQQPDTASLMGPANHLATRGAAWSFLRYAADRTGAGDESVFHRLVNSGTSGLENLDAVLGERALDWMHDWAVALYTDDHVPGVDVRYTQPSWHFRDLFAAGGQRYPLGALRLDAGAARRLSLQPGAASYFDFGVPAGGRAAIHVEADGATPPRTLRGSFVRVR
jgi:hypothetical protein